MVKIGRGAVGELTPRYFSCETLLQPCCGFTLDFTTLLKPSTMKLFDKNAIPPAALKPTSPIGTWSFPQVSLVFSKWLIFFSSHSSDDWKQPSWSHHTPSILVDGGMHAREWVTVGTALSLIGHLVGAFLFSHHFHFLHITFTITNATFAIEIALSHLMAECHFYDQGPCATFKKVKLFTTAEDCARPALTGINWWDIFLSLFFVEDYWPCSCILIQAHHTCFEPRWIWI